MKKSNTYDYAVSAFAAYIKTDRPKSGQLLALLRGLRREYLECSKKRYSRVKARRLRKKLSAVRKLYLDVYAIEKSLLTPETERDFLILKCIEKTYFAAAEEEKSGGRRINEKGRLSGLALACSLEENLSLTTVYDYLAEAVNKFCNLRRLRCDGEIDLDELTEELKKY